MLYQTNICVAKNQEIPSMKNALYLYIKWKKQNLLVYSKTQLFDSTIFLAWNFWSIDFEALNLCDGKCTCESK